jgi:hypothetical protein
LFISGRTNKIVNFSVTRFPFYTKAHATVVA